MNAALQVADYQHTSPVIAYFIMFVVLAMFLALWVTPDRGTSSDYFISERRLTSTRNGFAMFGDYVSAATLLGTPGLIALSGYDGIPYLLGPIMGCLVLLLLVAEPVHSTGRFTIGDCLARRLRTAPVHRAAGASTLLISLLYMVAQLVGAGALAESILGISGEAAQRVVVGSLGLLMIIYVLVGGMRAATLMQMVKAGLLLGVTAFLVFKTLAHFGFVPGRLLAAASDRSGHAGGFLRPGAHYGDEGPSKLDALSLQLAFALGTAGLPHVLMRLGAVPTAREARRSVQLMTLLTCGFCIAAGALGFGAAALVGSADISADSPSGNTATLLLAESLGGQLLLAIVACVAFATILAVVAGVTLASATSLAHDIHATAIMRGRASERSEVLVARVAVVLIGASATVLSLFAQDLNITFLAGLAVAASANLPSLLYSTYWRRFTTRGATWSAYGGLISSVLLVLLSPDVSGNPTALLPHLDLAVFPLRNPAIVSVPIGFLLGWLASVLDTREAGGAPYAETEVRVLAGARARDH